MKAMLMWSVRPGKFQECVQRFLTGQAAPKEGVSLLGRWFSVDMSCGFSLYESSDPVLLYKGAVEWAELMEFKHFTVIEDADVAPILAGLNQK